MNNEIMDLVESKNMAKGIMEYRRKQDEDFMLMMENLIQTKINENSMEIERKNKEYIDDQLIKFTSKYEIDKKELNVRVGKVEEKSNISYERTSTLEFTGKAKELMKAVHTRVYKLNGGKDTLECILFHSKLVNIIYGKLKDFYEVSRYSQIPEDSLEESLKMVTRWRPETNYKKKIMDDHRKRKDKGSLPISLLNAYERYLENNGGIL